MDVKRGSTGAHDGGAKAFSAHVIRVSRINLIGGRHKRGGSRQARKDMASLRRLCNRSYMYMYMYMYM